MGELLFWSLAVFAVLAGPPLVILLSDLKGEDRMAHQERQRPFGEARRGSPPPEDGDAGPSATSGMWVGVFLLAWIV